MSYDSIVNRGDYLSPHYLAEVLPRDLAKKTSLRTRWAERDRAGEPTPVKGLRALRRDYFDARLALNEAPAAEDSFSPQRELGKIKETRQINGLLLASLGYSASAGVLTVERGGEQVDIPVAYHHQNVVAIDCSWATDTDAAFDADAGDRLLEPLELSGRGTREKIETGSKLARWLFAADEPPRYVLLLHGGVVVLADRLTWAEGRYLAVALDPALERADTGELELIAALFSADALQPPAEGGEEPLAAFVDGSRQHAVGVSAELREGLRESVQLIANEVLDRLHAQGVEDPARIYEGSGSLAKDLGRQSLRYLYRILFLLYAEARPELGILPVDDEDYIAGYSLARLGELVARRLGGQDARESFHLYESLSVLFRMVNDGFDNPGDGEGLQFEALKADLFDPARTRLIGSVVDPTSDFDAGVPAEGAAAEKVYDTRLRDGVLYQVLRRLMLSKGKGTGRGGRKGRTERGGFISYAQLGISQLGAVYEGLMSYTGFIATEELYEVAKNGDPTGGSWMIPASKVPDYADDVFVLVKDENGFQTEERVRYAPGSFVYRLAGRDRQTSASYYTPQSLTSVTVQLALEQRVKEQENPPNGESGSKVSAAQVLRWRICEPALGSGAFLNEAIDQTAALYLKLREEETGDRLEPEERALALQRIKAYIALHNCYGVDLNETAVELAEVSIWLNVMHRGLQAPWFGLHLVRGNSLIGAGRRLYPASALTAKDADRQWLKTAPVDHPFSAGAIPAGHVHHFLLPAAGWGAVAGEKEAKELAPEQAKRLADWRRALRKAPSDKKTAGHKLSQVQRLQALSLRAEYLWSLVVARLRISEREISRPINVWGAENLPEAQEAIPRDQIVEDLTSPGTPYWRLKTVMDAWCALWFWPLDKVDLIDGSAGIYQAVTPSVASVPQLTAEPAPVEPDPNFPVIWEMDSLFGETPKQLTFADAAPKKPQPKPKPKVVHRSPVPLATLNDWLDFAESLLGRQDIKEGTLARTFDNLTDLSVYEEEVEDAMHMDMDSFMRIAERFPWLKTAEEIAAAQGFFHWELRFASVFAEGGFDIQVGNPPWVRPRWDEAGVLAEFEPWFKLAEKPPASEKARRRNRLVNDSGPLAYLLEERAQVSATEEFFSSIATYLLLVNTQPDSYRAFMCRAWANASGRGSIGLVHPDTHFFGDREAALREAAYMRLRIHGDFVNPGHRFFQEPVGESSHFGVHIYGALGEIGFDHLSWLFSVDALRLSWNHDGSGDTPSIRYMGALDERAHRKRIIRVDLETLALWRRLSGEDFMPASQARLLSPVSIEEQEAIRALAGYSMRIGDFFPQISRGYDESVAKNEQIIDYDLSSPGKWSEVVLKGIQIGVATPMFKSPVAGSNDVLGWDLVKLSADATPETEYRRATDISRYWAAQDLWTDRESNREVRYTELYRVAWRSQIAPDTERSLYAAIIPPGPAHVHLVHSMTMPTKRSTVLVDGFWSSLPLDYFVRVTGMGHLQTRAAKTLPFGESEHALADSLLLRTMRLNCLTAAYADLWSDVFEDVWLDDAWVCSWAGLRPLASVGTKWEFSAPLRNERERRAALVEIDALVAVWLGVDIDALIAMYNARFPVMNRFEESMWFDANGSKLAGNHRTIGQYQQRDSWKQFEAWQEDPEKNPVPDGYTAPFYKADRIAEYRQAHAAFTERMKRAQA